jgi:DNA-binding beta-propeller fold protein YncE
MKKLLLNLIPEKFLILYAAFFLITLSGTKLFAQSYVFEKEIALPGVPHSIKIDASQNVYVTVQNYPLFNIQKYNSSGTLVQSVGNAITERTYEHVVRNPVSTQVGVTDSQNDIVVLFNSSGVRIGSFGSPGSAAGSFDDPAGVAVDVSGNYYVVDKNNNRVQKFSQAGVFISTFGTAGTGNGQFALPVGISLDAAGNIYVADKGNNRIQKFDNSGNFLLAIGTSGTGDGQFNNPYAVAVDAAGKIYVTDQGNNRVQVFDASGTFVLKFGSTGSANGQFNIPNGIAVDASGNIFVVDYNNKRVEKFNSAGVFVSKFGTLVFNATLGFFLPIGMSLDAATNVLYIIDQGNDYIKTVNAGTNTLISAFGDPYYEPGTMDQNASVTVDALGNIFAADQVNNRIQKFDASGAFVSQFAVGLFSTLDDIAVDASNNVYTADVTNGTKAIRKFTNNGVLVATPAVIGQFFNARTVYVDNLNQIYTVVDNVITKMSSTGTNLLNFGGTGTTDNTFTQAFRLAVDNAGNIYVSDVATNQIKVFNSSGIFLTKFGTTGTGPGQTKGAFDIDVAADGSRVYYLDSYTGFSKVVVYKLTSVLPVVFTAVQGSHGSTGNKIKWDVATEENVDYYSVERSSEGVRYSEIGTVRPTNNSNGNVSYSWLDQNAANDTWFYRVRAIELSGASKISSTISIKAFSKTTFNIFPIPAKEGYFNLRLENMHDAKFAVKISDLLGRILVSTNITHQGGTAIYRIELPASAANGNYNVVVSDGHAIYKQSIILQK